MPRGRKRGRRKDNLEVNDFRHEEATRKNNLPAGLASIYEVRERGTTQYQYDPHLDPQLVWAGKAEHTSFEVDVVPLHIHEYISPKAILRAVRRPEALQLDLFGETPLPADQQVEFYKHEVGWTNRLILGDSLLVMNSLFGQRRNGRQGADDLHGPALWHQIFLKLPAPYRPEGREGRGCYHLVPVHRLRRQDLPHLPSVLPRRQQSLGKAATSAESNYPSGNFRANAWRRFFPFQTWRAQTHCRESDRLPGE